jgi:hypothetical protein
MDRYTEPVRDHEQQQLDKVLHFCQVGLGCCERLSQENMDVTRKLLVEADAHFESMMRGDATGFAAATGRIGLDYWGTVIACCAEFQKSVLASIAAK